MDLHSTMFLLIPDFLHKLSVFFAYLHSTMFLLIRKASSRRSNTEIEFTFHNVSINTALRTQTEYMVTYLHSTMFLLIPATDRFLPVCPWFTFHNVSINTTLVYPVILHRLKFTFHNVSINTTVPAVDNTLSFSFTFHNVSINTGMVSGSQSVYSWFTFHNVSINTAFAKIADRAETVIYIPQCFY